MQAQRQAWPGRIADIDPARFVFLDQAFASTALDRVYGYSPPGERVYGYVPYRHYYGLSMMCALRLSGEMVAMVYKGGTSIPIMETYVSWQLADWLRPDDVVVLDNLAAHKAAGVVSAIEACGAQVWHLPPYSPDFNPIEKMWSKVKGYLRKVMATATEPLLDLIGQALRTVTADDAAGWFKHCGYVNTHS